MLLERQHDQALIELEEAERLDPLDLQVKTLIGYVHHFHHDHDRAIEQFERVVKLEPSFAFAHYALGDACTQRGQYNRAFAEFDEGDRAGRAVGESRRLPSGMPTVVLETGTRPGSSSRSSRRTRRRRYVSPMWIALIHLGLSELDSLFQWLDRAFEDRDGSSILITAAVEFDPVRENFDSSRSWREWGSDISRPDRPDVELGRCSSHAP